MRLPDGESLIVLSLGQLDRLCSSPHLQLSGLGLQALRSEAGCGNCRLLGDQAVVTLLVRQSRIEDQGVGLNGDGVATLEGVS
jgi:hypothetical protein